MVDTPNVTYQNVLCSWCNYHVFYPLPDSDLLATCARCGEFKSVEDHRPMIINDVEKIK